MEQSRIRQRNTGLAVFFISGVCVISAGVVVSMLQELYGFAYSTTGTLLSLMMKARFPWFLTKPIGPAYSEPVSSSDTSTSNTS